MLVHSRLQFAIASNGKSFLLLKQKNKTTRAKKPQKEYKADFYFLESSQTPADNKSMKLSSSVKPSPFKSSQESTASQRDKEEEKMHF